jgi:RAD51-like protein 2
LPQRAESIAISAVDFMQRKANQFAQRALDAKKPAAPLPVPTVDSLLKSMHIFRAYDHIEQLAIIKSLPAFLRQHPNVHLLIIDSVAFHFRRGFQDMGLRSRLLTGMAQELLYLANQFQLAVRRDTPTTQRQIA